MTEKQHENENCPTSNCNRGNFQQTSNNCRLFFLNLNYRDYVANEQIHLNSEQQA